MALQQPDRRQVGGADLSQEPEPVPGSRDRRQLPVDQLLETVHGSPRRLHHSGRPTGGTTPRVGVVQHRQPGGEVACGTRLRARTAKPDVTALVALAPRRTRGSGIVGHRQWGGHVSRANRGALGETSATLRSRQAKRAQRRDTFRRQARAPRRPVAPPAGTTPSTPRRPGCQEPRRTSPWRWARPDSYVGRSAAGCARCLDRTP